MTAEASLHDPYLHRDLQTDPQPWKETRPVVLYTPFGRCACVVSMCASLTTSLQISRYLLRQLGEVGRLEKVGVFVGVCSAADGNREDSPKSNHGEHLESSSYGRPSIFMSLWRLWSTRERPTRDKYDVWCINVYVL